MADEMKEKVQQVEGVVKTLQSLVDQGFIKFPVARAYLGNFLTEVAAEYVRLRKENPDDKFQTLKNAIESARGKTTNTLLNKDYAPSAIVELRSTAPGLFGERRIDKYLQNLA